jgi:hypothetical protein
LPVKLRTETGEPVEAMMIVFERSVELRSPDVKTSGPGLLVERAVVADSEGRAIPIDQNLIGRRVRARGYLRFDPFSDPNGTPAQADPAIVNLGTLKLRGALKEVE